jgi:ribulose-bisphosphate carboxylase large chain
MERETNRLRVTYRLTLAAGESARAKARGIALEQTVELPEGCYPSRIERETVGEIESITALADGRAEAIVSYAPEIIGDDLLQVFNLLFGNISLQSGIRIDHIEWPAALLGHFKGPALGGIEGVRRLCGDVRRRPLLCAALKPVGLTAAELAALCRQFALGGIDIIKDDHSLVDQPAAPFGERVARCQDAVQQANHETGGGTVYFPNVIGGATKVAAQLEALRSSGCRGLLIAPLLAGLDTLRWIGRDSDLAILAHPALAGAYFQPEHGLAPDVLLGQLFRIAGADGVIYPNVGGRFPLTAETCESINARLREPLGALAPAFPVPAGGIDLRRVSHWIERYGPETIFLIGGSLYQQADLTYTTRRLVDSVRRSYD